MPTELPNDLPSQMQGYLDTAVELAIAYAPRIVGALLVVLVGRALARKLKALAKGQLTKRGVDTTVGIFLGNMLGATLDVMVYLAAISTLGIPTTSFMAILGAAGLAIGLALKDTLQHFASGVLLVLLRPFKIGDVVDAGGIVGTVEEITVFNTRIVTPDNRVILVPNANITGANIINMSAKPTRRVDLVFGVSYQDDIRAVKELLSRLADDDSRVLQEPAPKIAVVALADSSVNFTVRLWVKAEQYWDVYFDWQENTKIALEEAGFSIPFPQREMRIVGGTSESTTTN